MKSWRYKFRLLPILFAVLLVGCNREELPTGRQPENIAVVRARISARATVDDNAHGPAETMIRSLRVYAFDGDRLDKMFYKQYSFGEAVGEVLVEMEVTQTASKTFYVVVNESNNRELKGVLANIDNPAAFSRIEYRMADYFLDGMPGTVLNSSANFDGVDFCLPMFGKTENPVNTIGNYPQNNPLDVQMTVTRSWARVDVYVQKSADLQRTLTIDRSSSLTVANSREKGYLAPLAPVPAGNLVDIPAVAGSATALTVPVRNASDDKAALLAYTFYTPERSCAQVAERIAFTLKGVDVGGSRTDYPPVIIGNEPGKELTQIERNKVYKIYCTFRQKSVDLNLNVLDWNDKAVNGDVGGAMLTVSANKIVLDWYNLGQRFDTSVDYVSDGNVSFVGYVRKTAGGVVQTVTTDGSNLPLWLPKDKITNLPDGTTKSGKIGLEYVPTSEKATRYEVAIRIKTGNVVKDIAVIYDNGFIPNSFLQAQGWPADKLPNQGIQVAKMGNVLPENNAEIKEKTCRWGALYTSTDALDAEYGAGPLMTSKIISVLGSDPTKTTAAMCKALGPEWYLMSRKELVNLAFNRWVASRLSYEFTDMYYWSSTELNDNSAYNVFFINKYDVDQTKGNQQRVRCVRNF